MTRSLGGTTGGAARSSLITTEFDASSTAAEVVRGIDLTGRKVVVTGASSGIGVETARAFASAGAAVTLAVRDVEAGHRVRRDIIASTGAADLQVSHLDLAQLPSVEAFTASWRGPLHVLVNNAGVMDTPYQRNRNGWELQFATNHLGHFALALGLHRALVDAGGARVVSLSSSSHAVSPVHLDDLFFDRRPYEPNLAYGQSKTANVLFAVDLTRRWAAEPVTGNAVMPGGIWTGLQRHWPDQQRAAVQEAAQAGALGDLSIKTPEQGAATSVLVATHPAFDGVGGRYVDDCQEAPVVPADHEGRGVREYAVDPVVAERLWDVSVSLLNTARRDQR